MAGGVRLVLDDPDRGAVPRDPRRLGGQAGDAAEHVVQRHLVGDVRRDHPGDEGLPVRVRQPRLDGGRAAGRAVARRLAELGVPEQVVPVRMRREARDDGPARSEVVRDAGELVAEHPGVDEQDARPAVHDHGVALHELALVDAARPRRPASASAGLALVADGVAVHRDARVERSLLEQVELDRPVVVVEQRPAEAEDRGMGGEQQLVEQPGPEQLRGERRPAHADGAVGLGPEGGELLDRVVSADDPGVVVGAVPGAGDEHLGLGGPDLAVLAQEVRQRRVLARPWPVLLHDLVEDPAVDDERDRPRLRVELAVQLLVDAQPLAGAVVPGDLLDPQVEGHVHRVHEAAHRLLFR